MIQTSSEFLTTPAGERTAVLRGGPSAGLLRKLGEHRVTRVVLDRGDWRSIEFLREHPITHAVIRSECVDWNAVSSLGNLKVLVLEGAYRPEIEANTRDEAIEALAAIRHQLLSGELILNARSLL